MGLKIPVSVVRFRSWGKRRNLDAIRLDPRSCAHLRVVPHYESARAPGEVRHEHDCIGRPGVLALLRVGSAAAVLMGSAAAQARDRDAGKRVSCSGLTSLTFDVFCRGPRRHASGPLFEAPRASLLSLRSMR